MDHLKSIQAQFMINPNNASLNKWRRSYEEPAREKYFRTGDIGPKSYLNEIIQ